MAENCGLGLQMNLQGMGLLPKTGGASLASLGGGHSMLRLAEWSDRLEIGLPQIDAQHKRFFELAASFNNDYDQVRVMKTLAILSDYVRSHFRDEEELMAARNYPGLESHCLLHARFRYMLADLFARAGKMSRGEIAEEVKYLINGWFYNHIVTVDFEYAPYVGQGRDSDKRRSVG
jgi:hemerythrin-like metal-binding protein